MYRKQSIVFGFCALFAVAVLFVSCGNTAKIDYRMNVASQDANNYFNWTAGGVSVKDGFDESTSASKAKSTSRFDLAVTYDTPANAPKYQGNTLPGGLRSLFLYPVAPDSVRLDDKLTVTAKDKEITIRYVHRDSAYEIKTDANGKLDVLTGCKRAQGIATTEDQHTFTLKPEFSKTGAASGDMGDFDWSKATLAPETYSNTASRHYTGALDVAFAGNILTIKGALKETK
jgi:hypothetical protein